MRSVITILFAASMISSCAWGQSGTTAGGMSDITVLSVDIGHFDYGHKITHVYENSRNRTEYLNNPERWQFVIEPLLATVPGTDGSAVKTRVHPLDPIFKKVGSHTSRFAGHRVMVELQLMSVGARNAAAAIVQGVYPETQCKIGYQNIDVLPLVELTVAIPDIERHDGYMGGNTKIHSKSQSFLTSPKELYLSFDVWEKDQSPDKELKKFIEFIPFMQIDATVSFSVKSTKFNLAAISAEKIRNSELYVKLNGTGGVGTVTRNDLRKLSASAASYLHATQIIEDPTS
ncbi:MAG: hypothetical protein NVSMB26_24220 [Beijerinckiaceae bacterium]